MLSIITDLCLFLFIAVFIWNLLCLFGTYCVYLELAVGYRYIIVALKRFVSRRGTLKLFISDKFSTFKSTEVTDVLRHYNISLEFILLKSPCQRALREKCLYSELFWSVFSRIRTGITPNTDTFLSSGGFYEMLIGITKI